MTSLAIEVSTEGKPIAARQLAGLLMKNAIAALDETLQQERIQRWQALDGQLREAVKQPLLQAIRSPEMMASRVAAQAASEIAAVEIPYNEWPALLPSLLENIQSPQSTDSIRISSLECLGYTCERVAILDGPEINEQTTDSMLNAVVDGIQASRPDKVRLAATMALKNSLIFAHKNMERKPERDAIMTAICEATRCQDSLVRVAAYECIVQIAVSYYDKLQDYMTTLYELTTDSIKRDKEDVAKAAIEFWSSLCEVEQDLLDEAADLAERGLPVERPCMRYVNAALVHLAPILLETLTKQEEESDDEEFTLHMAGFICLTCISQTVEDAIVAVMMPFVQSNIQNENWRLRDAAMMAFISMLDGPKEETIGPSVSQSVPVLLNLLNDPHVMVRDTAAHCISRICLLHIRFIPTDIFPTLLQALIAKCGEGSPKVASQACSALYNLASAFSEEASQQQESNALSVHMQALLETLLRVCDRPDAEEANLRVAAMEAISVLISNSANDVLPIMAQLLPAFIQRFEATFAMQDFDNTDKLKKEQTQGLLCAVFQALYRKLDKATVASSTDTVMSQLLKVLQSKNANCHEECFSAISAISDVMEADFAVSVFVCVNFIRKKDCSFPFGVLNRLFDSLQKYMDALQPFLVQGLRNFQAYQVCVVAVGTVGDISRNIEARIQPYCDGIMNALVDTLKDNTIHRSVKPPVLACFGDIAMAIGAAFQPYMNFSMMLLMQASTTRPPEDDEDLVEYFNLLRESILEAYVGIVQGHRDGNVLDQLLQYVPSVLQFLEELANDPNRDDFVLSKAIGLVGDLAQALGPQIRDQINKQFVAKILGDGMASGDPSMVEMSSWASTVVSQACHG
jgi:importin subunit beta-1